MKPRLILLTLATVLLLSCSTDETIKNQLKIEAMKTETKTVTNHIAGFIQMNAAKFDCEIIETGLAGGNAGERTNETAARNEYDNTVGNDGV